MTANTLFGRDIITIHDLTIADVELIMATTKKIKQKNKPDLLKNKIIASCFFESSTRTRLSFESATLRSGGQVIGFSNDSSLSIQKGESLSDTIRVLDDYADLIVIRHPNEGAAALAAEVAKSPVINAGDGANQHPSQALIDLYTIAESQPDLNNLSIALVGDLKHGRTIHSLTQLLAHYNPRFYFITPEGLALPEEKCNELKKNGVRFSFHNRLEEIINKVDIVYMTRIQQERFSIGEYQLIKQHFILTEAMLKNVKPNLKILHPLPRVYEIENEVDKTPYAYYFQQASNGVPLRQALLTLILNEKAYE